MVVTCVRAAMRLRDRSSGHMMACGNSQDQTRGGREGKGKGPILFGIVCMARHENLCTEYICLRANYTPCE